MTQHPHAQAGGSDYMQVSERTSVAAVLSLLGGIACCPGVGLLAIVLGVFAIVGINRSGGRVGGKGLAVTGIGLGLMCSILWLIILVFMNMVLGKMPGVYKAYEGLVAPVMESIEDGDTLTARASFDRNLVTIEDASIDAFRAGYQGELGSYQRLPEGWIELVQLFLRPTIGPHMQQFQGRQDIVPIPALFDNDAALVVFMLDMDAQEGGSPVFADILVITPDGGEIRLTDFRTQTPALETLPDAAPAPEASP